MAHYDCSRCGHHQGIAPPYCKVCTTPEELKEHETSLQEAKAIREVREGLSALGIDFMADYNRRKTLVSQQVYNFLGPLPGLEVREDTPDNTFD
ncbi:hypothetical protein ABIE64_002644 [Thalassospira sp. MBR-102]|jgi:hypothetical protein|uniref:hypothetical protein n=1 Tax=Thalassospira sp. MBR-102 TaxID=3156466 RepID=UPI003398C710